MPYPTKKISEICEFQNGYAFKSSLFKERGEPILRISNIQNNNMSYNRLVYFNIEDYDKDLSKYIVGNGDLVIAMSGATTGKLAINNTNDNFYLNQRVGKLIFKNDITKKYTHYLLGTKIEENLNQAVGAAIPNLSTAQIKAIEIPLPPLSTQKLIVQKLDSAFKNIDESIEIVKKNIENVEELNKSAAAMLFNNGNFQNKRIGDIYDFMGSGFACNKSNEVIGGYTHLRTHNIGTDGKLNFDLFIDINPEKVDKKKSNIYKGDIIFNNTNSKELVGKTAYVEDDYNYGFSNHLTRIVIKKEHYSKYISYYLNYLFKKKYFESICNKWIGQAGVNNGMLKEVKIPLPPLKKQKEIVEYLDEVFEKNKAIKEKYEEKLRDLEEMKQSILKEAFEGRLVEG